MQCLKFGFTFWIWAGTSPQKNILGDYFTEGGLDYHFIGTDPRGAVPQHGQAQKHSYNDVYILQYTHIYINKSMYLSMYLSIYLSTYLSIYI